MNRILLSILSVFLLAGCSSLAYYAEEDAAVAEELVTEAVENGNLCILVDYIIPSRGQSRHSTDGYKLTVRDGKVVDAFLPFFGVNYNPNVYGVEPSGIDFEDCQVTIDTSRSRPEKGKYVWRFLAMSGTERVEVNLSFFSNGSAHIICSPANRTSMTYSGKLTYIAVKAE